MRRYAVRIRDRSIRPHLTEYGTLNRGGEVISLSARCVVLPHMAAVALCGLVGEEARFNGCHGRVKRPRSSVAPSPRTEELVEGVCKNGTAQVEIRTQLVVLVGDTETIVEVALENMVLRLQPIGTSQ